MFKKLVPSMLLVAGSLMPLFAATADERDVHFQTIRDLVEAGMRLPAERAIERFASANYPDANWHHKGLRFAYTDFFRTAAPAAVAGPLEEEYQRLQSELKAALAQLPEPVRILVEGAGDADLRRFVNIILRDLNPHAPPPLVRFTEERQREFQARLQRLLRTADTALKAAYDKVKAFEPEVERSWDFEPDSRQYQEIFQQAVLLRYEYANLFYTTYKALREIVQRGAQFGLSPSLARDVVEPWLHAKLKEHTEEFANWDWSYADVYPLLKHRMAVILSEAVRLNERRPDLGTISHVTYDDVRGSFYWVIDLDLSQFPRQFQEGLTILKYEAWADLMFWHLAMGTSRALDEAARIWDDFRSRSPSPLNHRDQSRQQAVGALQILGARIFHAREEMSRVNPLLVELQRSNNFFAANSRFWLTYFPQQGGGSSGWAALPTPEDPNIALSLASELRREARNSTDVEVANSMYMDALVALRNALLGLPASSDPEFLTLAPQVYQAYAFALFDRGLLFEAIVVAEEGLNRFRPMWQRGRNLGGNPWIRGETLSPGGELVQRLAGDLFAYTQRLRSRSQTSAARDAYGRSIDLLRIFDPARAKEGLDWNAFVIALQQGDFRSAAESLERYERNQPDQRLRVLGARARMLYAELNQRRDANASQQILDQTQQRMDQALTALRREVEPMIEGERPIPEGQAGEVQNLWRFLTTVEVATLFQAADYNAVLRKLDLDFWRNLQDDRELNRQLFNYLSGSAYRVAVANTRDQARRQDPNLMLELWPLYTNTVAVYERLVQRWPELVERFHGNRRQIAALFNAVRVQTNWFQQNVDAKSDGFAEFEEDTFREMTREAELNFARIFPIGDDTQASVILSVALAYWRQGDLRQAVPLFERYKKTLEQDATLQAFREDPTRLLAQMAETFSARQALRPFWERRGSRSIPDLLVDDPGLRDIMLDPNVRQSDWPEVKRDFAMALTRTNEFGEQLRAQRALISDFDRVWAEFERFRELVQGLAYSVQIDSWLVDAYQQLGRGPEAVALARELWDYDPLNPTFMALVIEGTLNTLRSGEKLPPADVRNAQEIAARLRNIAGRNPDRRDLYWVASIQVMELAHYLGDPSLINRTLQRHVVDNNTPPPDFSVPMSDPWRARDDRAVEIGSRYLELFDLPGVTVAKPYRIEERDGEVLFIREAN
ncbi:MAG: hypothetical protein EA402_12710 [Planctomycetota bacterium]|nr:MAG: hypothetical protein EA402_12710 [Planctomycetota bacterium]